jgi:uncharacterized SAM-binding protein YcdF (DUF218 family)
LLVASLVLLVILGFLPAGKVLMLVLEQRFPPWFSSGNPPDGIIVLGGAIEPERSVARGMVSLNAGAERVTELAALARRFPDARIVFTGGSANLIFAGPPESAFMLDLLASFGIPRTRVQLEERSRNTVGKCALHQGPDRSRSPASAGCWLRPPCICRARSACSGRPAFPSKPIRWIGTPRAGAM